MTCCCPAPARSGRALPASRRSPRREYDELKAILHNAARRGPEGQNRADHPDSRGHLLGRIAWVEQLNPRRGKKLHERFARIEWGG